MDQKPEYDLAALFQAVGEVLRQKREAFNQADAANGNHGDHMVEIFELASRAAQEKSGTALAEAMEYASQLLEQLSHNGSAQVYALGLRQLAEQFRQRQVTLPDLVQYVQRLLDESQQKPAGEDPSRSGELLKALVAGLAGWSQTTSGQPQAGRPLDMGALFEMGMAYMQAKQRGGSRAEVLADAAVSASPLSSIPHRYLSGKLTIQALLEAMQGHPTGQADRG